MKKHRADHLDEMQNQKLLKLEEYGFWIMFWALLGSILVQLIAGGTLRQVVGEIIVFFAGSIYLSITALRSGLWTRTSAPSRKGNAAASIIPAVLIGVIHGFKLIQNGGIDTKALWPVLAVMAAVFAGCFVLLEVFRAVHKKRRAGLDGVDEESEE